MNGELKEKTNKNTLEYLGVWENINNPDFNYPEFGVIGQEAGRMEILFELYEKYTANLFTKEKVKKGKK